MSLIEAFDVSSDMAFETRLHTLPELLAATTIPQNGLWQDGGLSREAIADLVGSWRGMDFSAFANDLRRMPHRLTKIGGQTLHFLDLQPSGDPGLAVLMLHGWPSSFLEMHAISQCLSKLRSVHCVIPSLPGFVFSNPLEVAPSVDAVAASLLELMATLDHQRFFIHASDWGAMIAQEIARRAPDRVVGVHLSFLPTPPPEDRVFIGEEERRATLTRAYVQDRAPYWRIQTQAPQTLGLALDTSPLGLLAWLADRYLSWWDPNSPVDPAAILRTATLYWATRSAASSMYIYHANTRRRPLPAPQVPLGVAVMPHDLVLPIRSLAEERFNVVQWTELEDGGHFPGFERPGDIAADLEAFVKELSNV